MAHQCLKTKYGCVSNKVALRHRIVRYADDILILCRSESAAHHALAVATDYLEGPLRLTVNVEKTHVTHAARGVKFLGVEIGTRWNRIQRKKVAAFKEQSLAKFEKSSIELRHAQQLADRTGAVRSDDCGNRSPASRSVSYLKQEPYTKPVRTVL